MFALIVSYTELPGVVAEQADTHGVWVKKYIDNGTFLCAGPKTNKLGGFILAKCENKARLLEVIAEDSYVIADVAEYQIVEFDCKITTSGLELLKNI